MPKNKIYIKIDKDLNVICIADDLKTVEFLADGAYLTPRGTDPSHPVEEEVIKGGNHALITRDLGTDSCTVDMGLLIPRDDMKKVISEYLKINDRWPSYYVSKINGKDYASSRQDMEAKIMGPLNTERTILMSDNEREYDRDRRIYLPY